MIYVYVIIPIVVLAIAIWYGVRIFVSRAKKQMYEAFAASHDLKLGAYEAGAYKMVGHYKSYPISLQSFHAEPDEVLGKKVRLSMPMTNPNLMYFRVEKGLSKASWGKLFEQEGAIHISHELGEALTIYASDQLFSGIILSEAMKKRIQMVFYSWDWGMVYIMGDELGAIFPEVLSGEDGWKMTEAFMGILVQVKDELNN